MFILLALALLYTVGYVAGVHGLGRLVVKPPSSRHVAFLAGWGIARLAALIPVAGGLAWTLLAIFGLGIIAVSARRRQIVEIPDSDSDVPASPPVPPMPA